MKKLTLLAIALLTSTSAMANNTHAQTDAFIKQHFLATMRATAAGMIDFAPKKPSKKQKVCIDKVLNDSADKLTINLTPKQYKAVEAMMNNSIGQSMHSYNTKVTSISSKYANILQVYEEREKRYNNATAKEIKVAQKADNILKELLQSQSELVDELPDDITKQCGIDITAR